MSFNGDGRSETRRQHGAAFATYADFNPEDLVWISGGDLLKTYQTSRGGGWCFCCECGSTLAAADRGRITSIALGCVDGDPQIKPSSHIFTGSKAQWFTISDDLPQYDKRESDD